MGYLRCMHFNFWKWEGAGNDFILFDQREWAHLPSAEQIHHWCDRENGLGADGVIFFKPLNGSGVGEHSNAWGMDYLNADGSRSFCGNGSRAVFALLRSLDWLSDGPYVLQACDGAHAVRWNDELQIPGVEMLPIQPPQTVPSQRSDSGAACFVHTGSPHHIEWLTESELKGLDVREEGARIRYGSAYEPNGTNVDFASRISETEIRMRTYERGVENETRACGTGATAAAVADYLNNGGLPRRDILMEGGTLHIELPLELPGPKEPLSHVWLYGPAKEQARGIWDGMKFVLSTLLFLIAASVSLASSDSAEQLGPPSVSPATLEISILTCSPGRDLYSAWGHTAIRLLDVSQVPPVDMVYNFGTFEFSEGFYTRFMRGQLDYRLARSSFATFQREYFNSGRAVLEQPLALSQGDAEAIAAYLTWNHLPENRVYAYKFFEDNCSSRVLTVMQTTFGDRWSSGCAEDAAQSVTYRQSLMPYIAGDSWITEGILFILGPRTDEVMPPCGSSYLPDGLMNQLLQCTLDGMPIAGAPEELIPPQQPWFRSHPYPGWAQPFVWAMGLLLWSAGWSWMRWRQWRNGETASRWQRVAGRVPLALAAPLGVLLVLMWTATDHRDTWSNWNLIWTLPAAIWLGILPWVSGDRRQSVQKILGVLLLLFLLLGSFIPQFVSLVSMMCAGAVWLSMDPWRVIEEKGWWLRLKTGGGVQDAPDS